MLWILKATPQVSFPCRRLPQHAVEICKLWSMCNVLQSIGILPVQIHTDSATCKLSFKIKVCTGISIINDRDRLLLWELGRFYFSDKAIRT